MSRLFSVKCHFRWNDLAHWEESCQNWSTESTTRCHGSYICPWSYGFRSLPWSIWSCGQIRAPTLSPGPNLSRGFLLLHGLWWQICFAVPLLTSCFVLCILMCLWSQLPSCALLLQLLDFSLFPLHTLCHNSCMESDRCIRWLPRIARTNVWTVTPDHTSCQPVLTSFFFMSQLVSMETTLHREESTHSQFWGRCQMTPKRQL